MSNLKFNINYIDASLFNKLCQFELHTLVFSLRIISFPFIKSNFDYLLYERCSFKYRVQDINDERKMKIEGKEFLDVIVLKIYTIDNQKRVTKTKKKCNRVTRCFVEFCLDRRSILRYVYDNNDNRNDNDD